MPPGGRGRSRKVGNKRIDAAYGVLEPLGFSKNTISKTINNLLKLYDGDAGWVFIEEASYKLVIETILEHQEEEEKEKEEGRKDEEQARDVTTAMEVFYPQPVESVGNVGWKDISVDHDLRHTTKDQSLSCSTSRKLSEASPISQKLDRPQIRQRPPCYGWISESEEEDEPAKPFVIHSGPAVDNKQDKAAGTRIRKRPRGWDVKPSDV